ncbi:MAG: GNAT family N-acetyltransferase [Sediminibacterium sp.]
MEQKPRQEQLDIKIEIVDIPTPQILEAIKNLRIAIAQDPEEAFYLVTDQENEESMTNEERAELFFGEGKFVSLAWSGNDIVGMNRAENQGSGLWYIGSFCIKKQFRGRLGERLFKDLLREISKRGGIKIVAAIKKRNTRTLHTAQRFGFKVTRENNPLPYVGGFDVELDLTKPEVLQKLKEVSDER